MSKKKILIVIALLITIIISTLILANLNKIKIIYYSYTTGYQKEAIDVFIEEDIYNSVVNNKYSKTLDEIINTEYYQKEFLQDYLNINYIDTKNFLKEISILLNKGYNNNDINTIYKKLTSDGIETLLEEDYLNHWRHTYDDGVITKEATHFDEGVKTYTCTVCGRTKEEAIEKTNEHMFTEWYPSQIEEDKHERVCNCGEKETADCTFDKGKITKQTTTLYIVYF